MGMSNDVERDDECEFPDRAKVGRVRGSDGGKRGPRPN